MVLAALRSILCCCRHEPEAPLDGQEEFDETSHLIRHTIEAPAIRVDDEYERQRRHHERLATIVRNTSGRMVNLSARLPFNLHNQVLPPSESRSYSHSATRSVSPSHGNHDALDHYHDLYTSEHDASRHSRRLHPYQLDQGSRSGSPDLSADDTDKGPKIQVMATRLLGVRIVTRDEAARTARGRPTERSGLPLLNVGSAGASDGGNGDEEGEATPRPEPRKFEFKIPDVGPLTVDWD